MEVNLIKCNSQALSDLLHSPPSKERNCNNQDYTNLLMCVCQKTFGLEYKYMCTNTYMYILM